MSIKMNTELYCAIGNSRNITAWISKFNIIEKPDNIIALYRGQVLVT